MTQREKAQASLSLADRRRILSEQVRRADPEILDRIERLLSDQVEK